MSSSFLSSNRGPSQNDGLKDAGAAPKPVRKTKSRNPSGGGVAPISIYPRTTARRRWATLVGHRLCAFGAWSRTSRSGCASGPRIFSGDADGKSPLLPSVRGRGYPPPRRRRRRGATASTVPGNRRRCRAPLLPEDPERQRVEGCRRGHARVQVPPVRGRARIGEPQDRRRAQEELVVVDGKEREDVVGRVGAQGELGAGEVRDHEQRPVQDREREGVLRERRTVPCIR